MIFGSGNAFTLGRATWLISAGLVILPGPTSGADIPVAGRKLIVLDKVAAAGQAKAVYVTAQDPGVTKGAGTDPLDIESALNVVYGSFSGAFVMPQGTGWLVNSATVAKYVNKAAPADGAVKTTVIKPGGSVKVVARSLGDVPLDVAQPQNDTASVAYTVTNGVETTRHCAHFVRCRHKVIAGGTGAKLVCKGNSIGDGACNAAEVATEAIGVSVGAHHTCALLDTGAVKCWGGNNGFGTLGYGNTSNIGDDDPPSSAGFVPVGAKVVQVAAGQWHTCVLLDGGAVRCWGGGGRILGYGNFEGLGDYIGDDEPAGARGDVNIGGTAVQIAAGSGHTCALLDTGNVRCWGWGFGGALGYGNTDDIGDDEPPASAGDVDVGGTVVQIATGASHTCALLDTGNVRCWGLADTGRLGYGNGNSVGDDETPASAGDVDVGGTVVQIATGGRHTCALLDTGSVRCWGRGAGGRLGYGNTNSIGDDETPASAGDVDVGGTVIQITAGEFATCALLDTGAVRCWGFGTRLGYGNTNSIGDDETPASAGDIPLGGPAVYVTAGPTSSGSGAHTCALMATGAVRCWGLGAQGQLGYGNTNSIGDDETPASAGDVPFL